jgi:hypothetical protein
MIGFLFAATVTVFAGSFVVIVTAVLLGTMKRWY